MQAARIEAKNIWHKLEHVQNEHRRKTISSQRLITSLDLKVLSSPSQTLHDFALKNREYERQISDLKDKLRLLQHARGSDANEEKKQAAKETKVVQSVDDLVVKLVCCHSSYELSILHIHSPPPCFSQTFLSPQPNSSSSPCQPPPAHHHPHLPPSLLTLFSSLLRDTRCRSLSAFLFWIRRIWSIESTSSRSCRSGWSWRMQGGSEERQLVLICPMPVSRGLVAPAERSS
mmetsp:Transcript_29815/g.67441  ORF Transcript_29815/g.67441 Transcript_29815/m.67441 type:complete len:231 (-) Transcript_29815:150-842(-)